MNDPQRLRLREEIMMLKIERMALHEELVMMGHEIATLKSQLMREIETSFYARTENEVLKNKVIELEMVEALHAVRRQARPIHDPQHHIGVS